MVLTKKSKIKTLKKNRVIARLDIKGPNLIKGISFEGLRVIGSPIKYAEKYYLEGIDELIYIDTVATLYGRNNLLELVKKVGEKVFIPITVGGGIRTVNDARNFLNAGADKVSFNTAAIKNPSILKECSESFGSQCTVLAIDAKLQTSGRWSVFSHGGRNLTDLDVLEWSKKAVSLGVGEILLTSMDADGTKLGYDIKLTNLISSSVK